VRHQTHTLKTCDDLTLFTQCWLPEERASAAIILSHGYAEHSGRYEEMARRLVSEGYAVYALDHRGHGLSEGARANVGVFREYVDDLQRFIEKVRETHPRPPRFLFGHSMGGLIAMQLVLEHPEKVEGVVVCAALIQNAVAVPPSLLRAADLVSALAPGLPVQKLDVTALSRDEAVVRAYQEDPLVYHGRIKARLGTEMLRAGPYVLVRAESIRVPLLLLHGTGDRIAHAQGSRDLLECVGSEDKTLKLYDGAYHEVFNDFSKEEAYRDLLVWLAERID